jgi:DNA-binding SARP family transcriptional activator
MAVHSSAEPPALNLELVCFGPPRARVGGRSPPELLWRKHLGFLVYLALSPGRTRTRQHLLGVLWPEKEEDQARHSLNEAVRRLRGCLGADRIVSQGDSLTLSDSGLVVDALSFDVAAGTEPLRALALLTGDFLEGFDAGTAPPFDEWAEAMRERYRAAAGDLLVRAGAQSLLDSRPAEAAALARRALTLQPYLEPAASLLVRACALGGDAAGALAAYHEFRERQEAELGERPSRELDALADRLRRERWRESSRARASAAPVLVARNSERLAFGVTDQALHSGPRTLVITGNPGTGRTRLLGECLDRLALAGAAVAVARPLETDHDAPWSTLRALMRAGLCRAPGIVAADPEALALLAALVPELEQRVTPRAPRDLAQVGAALASLLRAAAEEGPVGLGVDDAELADGASVGALHAAVGALGAAPVMLVVTTVPGADVARPELLALRGATGRGLPGLTVRLDPFTPDELLALVRALAPWCREEQEIVRLARRIGFETGGNALLAVTLLGALQKHGTLRGDLLGWPAPHTTLDSPLPISVPELARLAIIGRVTALEAEASRVLAIASTLGLALDLDLIVALGHSSRPQIEALLPAMERASLIVFDGERYAFATPLVAQVVRGECLTPGQRRAMRRRAVELLATRVDLESRILRTELLGAVDPGTESFSDALAVARDALAADAIRTARRALRAAERSVAAAGADERALFEQLQRHLATATTAAGSGMDS